MSGLSEEELAVIEAIAEGEDNGDTGLDRAARAVLPRWTDDRYMQLLVHLQESGFVDVKTKGHPRIVQVKIVGTTYNGRSALNAARPARVNVARVLSLDERKDIDVFVRLLAAALGEAEQNRPGPLGDRDRRRHRRTPRRPGYPHRAAGIAEAEALNRALGVDRHRHRNEQRRRRGLHTVGVGTRRLKAAARLPPNRRPLVVATTGEDVRVSDRTRDGTQFELNPRCASFDSRSCTSSMSSSVDRSRSMSSLLARCDAAMSSSS